MVRLKAETGARVSSRPRHGYIKNPADPKWHMVPDPKTAQVVRYIFDLCVSGKGVYPDCKAAQERQNFHALIFPLPDAWGGADQSGDHSAIQLTHLHRC